MKGRNRKVRGPEETPCRCGCSDPVRDEAFLELHFRMQLGKPFNEEFHCRRCGAEVFTMHFHGQGEAAMDRMEDFVAGPGRFMGPHFAAVVDLERHN
jgi:hypothetical protein